MGNSSLLEVYDLHVRFGTRVVLEEVSFALGSGEILGIMGASGGGKSTILKAIIGLLKPERGRILFHGQDLTQLSESELLKIRPKIGYVFQNGALFDSMTINENLSYPLVRHTRLSDADIQRHVNERLRLVQMEGVNDLYPNQLSGGMLKRAGLLRATMLEPSLVLFDEPTAGLDPISIRNFVTQITKIRKDRNLSGIFISHDAPSVLAICDRIAILWEGRIRTIDSARVIRDSQDPVIRSFVQPELQEVQSG